jgi:beta-hydroxylase
LERETYARTRESARVKYGKRLRRPLNRFLAGQSLIPTDPFLDSGQVPGIGVLQDEWQPIRDEALGVMADGDPIPPLARISPDHRRIARNAAWKSYFFKGYGYDAVGNCARCPHTAALIDRVPGVVVAFYSIFEPGTRIAPHHGVTKAMLNVHLGLSVPPGGPEACGIRVGDEVRGWSDGEFLVFDETWKHEAWNETLQPRVVLFLQVMRPMTWAGRLAGKAFLGAIRRTSYVQDARKAIGA